MNFNFNEGSVQCVFSFTKNISTTMWVVKSFLVLWSVLSTISDGYGNISYRIPDGWYLRGLYITAQYERDRTFFFQLCRIGKIELEQKDEC
ncbi:hypothetical protein Bpfe_013437 [Biomphalaria pfeifferi]|uniref:Uncharacterized protein n=1 Tax=Biomphalaria pfeifferi TaxID=112525 RepID=A0AAD8BLZ9_BIOPF|nr:hypothetical protein Bpfe_013437 [Biomphalaria pfeifferi]